MSTNEAVENEIPESLIESKEEINLSEDETPSENVSAILPPEIHPISEELERTEIKQADKAEDEDVILANLVLELSETDRQNLFDSLYSSVVNQQSRDTVLHILFWKGFRLLNASGLISGTPESETEFAEKVGKLSSQDRQVLYDSVCSSIENQRGRDTVLHVLFWKACKLIREAGIE
ncbi:hypothetical protein [Leptospira adleri]|uniref:hypothetical protein n=1 Tax=Leptospira adleri TaxID=2023186 RepID=UPI001FB00378|nr:hypothetical protein [Leptospira adleri]